MTVARKPRRSSDERAKVAPARRRAPVSDERWRGDEATRSISPPSGSPARVQDSSACAAVTAELAAAWARSSSSSSASASVQPSTSPAATTRPRTSRLDEVGQHVALGDHQRRPAGDVVQQPRAEGQPGLERVAVRAHPDVGLGEPGEALVVRHPGSVEEDRASSEPELCRRAPRPGRPWSSRRLHCSDAPARGTAA